MVLRGHPVLAISRLLRQLKRAHHTALHCTNTHTHTHTHTARTCSGVRRRRSARVSPSSSSSTSSGHSRSDTCAPAQTLSQPVSTSIFRQCWLIVASDIHKPSPATPTGRHRQVVSRNHKQTRRVWLVRTGPARRATRLLWSRSRVPDHEAQTQSRSPGHEAQITRRRSRGAGHESRVTIGRLDAGDAGQQTPKTAAMRNLQDSETRRQRQYRGDGGAL